jgi:hypothetical protein
MFLAHRSANLAYQVGGAGRAINTDRAAAVLADRSVAVLIIDCPLRLLRLLCLLRSLSPTPS